MTWLFALIGCGPSSFDVEPYVILRGTVDPAVQVDGDDGVLRGLWTIAANGELCTEVQPLELVPYVTAFEIPIPGPPDSETRDACIAVPEGLGTVGFGLLVLLDPESGKEPSVTSSPLQLLEWFAGDPLRLSEILVVQNGVLAGVVSEQVLIVFQGESAFDAQWCRFDSVLSGLTLYEDEGVGCGGWTPVDAPGVRDEIQGIQLIPPP